MDLSHTGDIRSTTLLSCCNFLPLSRAAACLLNFTPKYIVISDYMTAIVVPAIACGIEFPDPCGLSK